ncbi:MAG: hypothetical protein ACOCTR_00935 [Candidatus Natronoplasma sp.]
MQLLKRIKKLFIGRLKKPVLKEKREPTMIERRSPCPLCIGYADKVEEAQNRSTTKKDRRGPRG